MGDHWCNVLQHTDHVKADIFLKALMDMDLMHFLTSTSEVETGRTVGDRHVNVLDLVKGLKFNSDVVKNTYIMKIQLH